MFYNQELRSRPECGSMFNACGKIYCDVGWPQDAEVNGCFMIDKELRLIRSPIRTCGKPARILARRYAGLGVDWACEMRLFQVRKWKGPAFTFRSLQAKNSNSDLDKSTPPFGRWGIWRFSPNPFWI